MDKDEYKNIMVNGEHIMAQVVRWIDLEGQIIMKGTEGNKKLIATYNGHKYMVAII